MIYYAKIPKDYRIVSEYNKYFMEISPVSV